MSHFDKVRDYLMELEYSIIAEDKENGIFVIDSENDGIKNLIIDIEEPIVIIEQHLFNLNDKGNKEKICFELLKKNREIVHGAFVLDHEGKQVLFRDTLQIETLDAGELEGSLSSLSLLLSEYSNEIINFSKN